MMCLIGRRLSPVISANTHPLVCHQCPPLFRIYLIPLRLEFKKASDKVGDKAGDFQVWQRWEQIRKRLSWWSLFEDPFQHVPHVGSFTLLVLLSRTQFLHKPDRVRLAGDPTPSEHTGFARFSSSDSGSHVWVGFEFLSARELDVIRRREARSRTQAVRGWKHQEQGPGRERSLPRGRLADQVGRGA